MAGRWFPNPEVGRHSLIRTIRRFSFLFFLTLLLVFGGFWGWLLWLETPRGASHLSGWITHGVEKQFPETTIALEGIRFHFPFQVEVGSLRWRQPEALILRMDRLALSADLSLRWKAKAHVARLALGPLEEILGKDQWGLQGFLEGDMALGGRGSSVEEVELKFTSQAPGGTVSNALLRPILSFMPPGESRSVLLRSVQEKPVFDFQIARLEVETEGSHHRFFLSLDGDHRIDVTIRFPKESVGLLRQLMN